MKHSKSILFTMMVSMSAVGFTQEAQHAQHAQHGQGAQHAHGQHADHPKVSHAMASSPGAAKAP